MNTGLVEMTETKNDKTVRNNTHLLIDAFFKIIPPSDKSIYFIIFIKTHICISIVLIRNKFTI